MSKITNDESTRSGTGCFTAVPIIPYGNSERQRVKIAVDLSPSSSHLCWPDRVASQTMV